MPNCRRSVPSLRQRRIRSPRARLAATASALLVIGGSLAGQKAAAETMATPLTVVELFTSQGCSSCPPADALIGELAGRADVLALSEHVDYWDYLGWKDPYGAAANTARQREYARALGLRYVYTPQIVVHGASQMAGTERAQVLRAIAVAKPPPLALAIRWPTADRLAVRIGAQPGAKTTTVWLVLFDKVRTTRIGSGENDGRQLVNHHVVREFRAIGAWSGDAVELTADVPPQDWSAVGCAVLVQVPDGGPIVGAARCAPIGG